MKFFFGGVSGFETEGWYISLYAGTRKTDGGKRMTEKNNHAEALVGKTIEKIEPLRTRYLPVYLITFSDKTTKRVILGGLSKETAKQVLYELFLPLWDSAGTARYDKSKWNKLDDLLCEIGMRGGVDG